MNFFKQLQEHTIIYEDGIDCCGLSSSPCPKEHTVAIQDALSAVEAVKWYLNRIWSEEEFNIYYEKALTLMMDN